MSDDHPLEFDPEELGDSADDAARPARGRRRRRPDRGVRPHRRPGPRRRSGVVAVGARRHRHVRLERIRPGPEEGLRRRLQRLHQGVGHQGRRQHRRPQHLPGADQRLPAGPPAGRLHLVRRLPDAVLRAEGAADADRRRLGRRSTPQLLAGDAGSLEGPRRALLLRPDLQLPVGRLLPEERLQAARLQGPEDVGSVHRAREEDEERRPDADRVRGQGRLAGDGHVRHPQHADQRLRLPRPPDGRQGGLGRPEGEGRLQPVARAPPVHLAGCARADLAGRRAADDHQEGRHVPARLVRRAAGDDARQIATISTSSPTRRSTRRTGRTRSTLRSTAS